MKKEWISRKCLPAKPNVTNEKTSTASSGGGSPELGTLRVDLASLEAEVDGSLGSGSG